jgi:enoyl-CoA hydratase
MTEREQDAENPRLLIVTRAPLAIVRFHRPSQRNALSLNTLRELETAINNLTAQAEIKAILFTGTGDVFASGADIGELRSLVPHTAREFAVRGQRLFQRIAGAPQITVAAINGYCMGGALDLALACDVRFASASAVFAHPGARLGIITGWGGTQRLPRLIGAARAIEMFATARRLTSDEAYSYGLVDRVCGAVLDDACEYALSRI